MAFEGQGRLMINIAIIREALTDSAIASYPDFTKAVTVALDQLERFQAERGYIVGFNDGYETALEHAAELVEANAIQDTSDGKQLMPRQEGNREGLHYADVIRELAFNPSPASRVDAPTA